jgi:hypothetical protein
MVLPNRRERFYCLVFAITIVQSGDLLYKNLPDMKTRDSLFRIIETINKQKLINLAFSPSLISLLNIHIGQSE